MPLLPTTGVRAGGIAQRLMDTFVHLSQGLWRIVPGILRVAVYKMLSRVGKKLYGDSGSSAVQRLPFGLSLKTVTEAEMARNEFNALRLVRQYTSITAPRPIDLVIRPNGRKDEKTYLPFHAYLLMSRVPGRSLASCSEMLSDKDIEGITTQMQDYIQQLRQIDQTKACPSATRGMICNSRGGACQDSRIMGGDPVGPFLDEPSFSKLLRYPDEPSRRGHDVVFTHANLNLGNIMVDVHHLPDGTRGWRVSSVVGWEFAGFYPRVLGLHQVALQGGPNADQAARHDARRVQGDQGLLGGV